jgi:hypothetical protein
MLFWEYPSATVTGAIYYRLGVLGAVLGELKKCTPVMAVRPRSLGEIGGSRVARMSSGAKLRF